MNSITQVIRKVATAARKTVLTGALVGGVSMIASATETTETNVGPTIGKAQLETVHINLDAVVAAIAKVDPDWVKGLPMVATNVIPSAISNQPQRVADEEEWYLDPSTGGNPDNPNHYVLYDPSNHPSCDGLSNEVCTIKAPKNESTNKPILDPSKPVTVTESFYSPTRREL